MHAEKAAVPLTRCSGFRLVLRGCNANNGSNAGLADVNVNNGVSNSNANIGSPLNFIMDEVRGLAPRRKINKRRVVLVD